MVRVVFVDEQGTRTVDAADGETLMQAAGHDELSRLIGECGGSCICASCHAYIEPEWLRMLPPASFNETQMLDVIDNARYNSRLTCRVRLSPALDGIVVRVPCNQR